MKGILNFNLPEEQEQFTLAQNGISYKLVCDDFLEHIRMKLKYGPLEDGIQTQFYEDIRAKFLEIMGDYDL